MKPDSVVLVAVSSLVVGTLLTGCATSGYTQFYSPMTTHKYPPTQSVRVIKGSEALACKLLSEGYEEVGRASFNGPQASVEEAVAQAKRVGADTVLLFSKYTHTDQGVASIPQYSPPQTTTINSTTEVNANVYGPGGYAHGTATGQTTTDITTPGSLSFQYVPVAVSKFDQSALFFRYTGHKELPNTSAMIPVAKKAHASGLYFSPYAEAYDRNSNGIFAANGISSGEVVRCPFTGKKVRIP